MVNKIKKELTRVSTRLSRLLVKNGKHHWPANVLETLETKYNLLPRDLLRLWYIRHRMLSNKARTESIIIYDWEKAYDQNISIRRFKDINKYPELLRYKGFIASNGEVKIEEIRKN
jgi:hypothetical protein